MNKKNVSFFWGLSVILFFVFSGTAVAQYQPPTGIPAPPFGINEQTYNAATHCPKWPAGPNSKGNGDAYDCYYVDNSVSCIDSNNSYGYPNSPRCSLPQGSLSAGAYVDVRGGRTNPYSPSGEDRIGFWGTGTASDYILISGSNAPLKPILSKFVHIGVWGSASYLIFEGFEIQTSGAGLEIRPGRDGYSFDHISARNNVMHGNGAFKTGQTFFAGADQGYYPNSNISYVVFYNNESYDAGSWNSLNEDDTCSFYVGDKATYIWILDNLAYRSGGDGVAGGHSANRTSHHLYVGRNTFYQHRENGIDLKEIDNIVISENIIYSHRPTSSSSGEAIVIHYGSHSVAPNEAWVIYNKIYDCEIGVVFTQASNAYVIGNLIYNINHTNSDWNPSSAYSNGAGIHIRGVSNAYLVDNTLYGYDTGIEIPTPETSGRIYIHGNILSNRIASAGYEILVPTGIANVDIDYCQVYSPSGSVRIGWGSTSAVGLSTFKFNSGKCSNCAEGDPKFIAPATINFGLQSTSPCLDTNIKSSIYDTFYGTYGVNIQKDIKGVSRPRGLGWDKGAYERSSTIPAPTNLRVVQ